MTYEQFTHATPMTVRFGDLDAMGHLNNAKYATYTEQARIRYIMDVCGFRGAWHELGMILARLEIDFKRPIVYEETVTVYTRCTRIGGKSFDLAYAFVCGQGETRTLAASALSVLVAFDYGAQQSIPVPQAWRVAMQAYDGLASG